MVITHGFTLCINSVSLERVKSTKAVQTTTELKLLISNFANVE